MFKIKNNKKTRKQSAQVLIEFMFSMMVVLFMIYSIGMIFRWTGVDHAARRVAHSSILRNQTGGLTSQYNPYFYRSLDANAVWNP